MRSDKYNYYKPTPLQCPKFVVLHLENQVEATQEAWACEYPEPEYQVPKGFAASQPLGTT